MCFISTKHHSSGLQKLFPEKLSGWRYEHTEQETQWVAKDKRFLHADSEDSDQTGRMPKLIWVFAEGTATSLVLSCRGSIMKEDENTEENLA